MLFELFAFVLGFNFQEEKVPFDLYAGEETSLVSFRTQSNPPDRGSGRCDFCLAYDPSDILDDNDGPKDSTDAGTMLTS